MLKVDIQSAPPVVIIHCSGRLVLGVEAETLRCIATSRPERHLVLDLSHVHGIDAAGLGLLVELHQWAQKRSVRLTIAISSGPAHRLLALTCLDRVLPIVGVPVDCSAASASDRCQSMSA